MLELSLLGEPLVRYDGSPVRLTIRKGLALLALLALDGPALRVDLCRLLWPAFDRSTALRNLRRELARLREAGLAGGLVLDRERLALAVGVAVDVHGFEQALRDDDPAAALALCRGRFAEGLELDDAPEFVAWVDDWRGRVDAARHDALERLAVRAEAAGDVRSSLRWRQRILAEDALQERLHREVMRLHGLLGEREAALAQYERCREVLERELGLAPMAETEQLLAALRGDEVASPVAAAEAPAGAVLGMIPDLLPFVGRVAAAAAMEQAWDARRAIVVSGAGGVGKSRLAADFAAAHGAFAAYGCRGSDAGIPYGSFTRVLRGLLAAGAVPEAEWIRGELARLLPELGAAPPPLADDTQRLRFLEACVQAWLASSADNFAAVVIDDLHLADGPSAELFVFIAQRLRESAEAGFDVPRLLVTLRGDETAPALADRLAALIREGAAVRLELAPLESAEVFDLVHRLSNAASPRRFAARLHRATGGNAFFLHETLRHLVATGWLTRGPHGEWRTQVDESTADYQELPLPGSVFEAALARVHRAGQGVTRVLEAASLATEPFDAPTLAGATALSDFELAEAFDSAEGSQLIALATGGYRFAHDLLRQALATQLPAARRRLLHARLAGAGERGHAAAAVIAGHWQQANEPERALPWLLAAGRQAVDRRADAEATGAYELALQLGAGGLDALEADRALVELHRRDDDAERALAASASALARAMAIGDPVLLAEVEIEAARLETLLSRGGDALARIDVLRQRSGLPLTTRARIECAGSDASRQLGRSEDARAASEAMLRLLAGAAPDREHDLLRRDAFESLAMNAHERGNLAEGVRAAERMSEVCRRLDDAWGHARAEHVLGVMHLVGGDSGPAAAHLGAARALFAELRDVNAERMSILNLMKVAGDAGDADTLLALAHDGWKLSPRFASPHIRQGFLHAFFYAHGLRGDLGATLEAAARVREEAARTNGYQTHVGAAIVLFDFYLYLGDLAAAESLVAAVIGSAYPGAPMDTIVRLKEAMLHIDGGRLAEAAESLAACGSKDALQGAEEKAIHALRCAELALARGKLAEADAALQAVVPPNRELAMLLAAVRLDWLVAAQARPTGVASTGGPTVETSFAAARALLAEGRAPAWFALRLRLSLGRALAACGRKDQAAQQERETRRELARLAATLDGHPVQRAGFLARHGG